MILFLGIFYSLPAQLNRNSNKKTLNENPTIINSKASLLKKKTSTPQIVLLTRPSSDETVDFFRSFLNEYGISFIELDATHGEYT